MENEEEFVASLKALLVRYGFEIVVQGKFYFLKDPNHVIYTLEEFLSQIDMRVDSE